ncbi:MAG: MFS transporter [Nitrososphaerota archaeon]|nr:MFS transporter [Nitrososphaerota archaeon]
MTTEGQLLESLDESSITRNHVKRFLIPACGHLFDNFTTFNITPVLPILIGVMSLTATQQSTLISSVGIGGFVGAIAAGPISDAIGRKRTYILATALYAITDIITGTIVNNFTFLYAMRIVEGFAVGAEIPIMAVYIAEFIPRKRRGWAMAFASVFGNTAAPLGTVIVLLTRPEISWHGVFLIPGILGLILLPFSIFYLPESVRYLMKKGKMEEAEKLVRRTSALDPSGMTGTHALIEEKAPISSLLRGGFLRPTLSIWALFSILTIGASVIGAYNSVVLVRYTHLLTLQNYLGITTLTALATPAGSVLGGALMESVGRRSSLTVAFGLSGLFWLIDAYGLAIHNLYVVLLFGTLASFLLSSQVSVIFALGAELYPTGIRNTASALTNAFLRSAGIYGPLIYGLYISTQWVNMYAITGVITLIGAVIALFGIYETKGKSMEKIVADLSVGSGVVISTAAGKPAQTTDKS